LYSRRMRWTGHVAHVDRRILLEWILKKQILRVWTGFMWLRIGTYGGIL